MFWFKLDKVLLYSTDDLLCGVVYIPPEGTCSRYASHDCFLEIEQELINITNESKDAYDVFVVWATLMLELLIWMIFFSDDF